MLDAFFAPRAVAVIGASSHPEKLGYAVVENLLNSGYAQKAKIFPINPHAPEILGLQAFPSVLDVPQPIDLAILVVPYPLVPHLLNTCGQKNIPAAIIISAGFREAGQEGLERERELLTIARQHHIRIIGPNCLGIIDSYTPLNATFAADTPPSGPMAFMSQSGALGVAILDWAQSGRLGLAKFVSLGNKADVDEVDLLQAWADDPHTAVILIYSEELTRGQQFISTARTITPHKPILAIKSGVTQAGARAVSSHTGSLAGSRQAYEAAFRQAGVLQAESLEALFDMAMAFAYQPPLPGKRIAILTNAGGPGILATDALEAAGLTIARLRLDTIRTLEERLADAASVANPVDVLGDATPAVYGFAMRALLQDPNVDGLLAVLVPQAVLDTRETASVVAEIAKGQTKPILACFMGERRMGPAIEVLTAHNIPNYPFPKRAARVFGALARYQEIHQRPTPRYVTFEVDRAVVRQTLDETLAQGRLTIGDAQARAILEAYRMATPRAHLAATPDEAVQVASQIGYPVALKIASPDILHKTDVGGVRLDLRNATEVRDAFELMIYRAQRYLPEARLWGCLVQEMAPPGGLEVLIGMARDPQFGPLVTFGLGGIYVEALRDVSFRIAPFSPDEARAMLTETRAHALLEGFRGQPPVDSEALVEALLRVGQLCLDFPEIVELDINPLVVYPQGEGAIALDMRLVLSGHPGPAVPRD